MVEERGPNPGLINLFGLPVGARSQTPLPTPLRLDPVPSGAMPVTSGAVSSTRNAAFQLQKSQSLPAAPIPQSHPDSSVQRSNRGTDIPPPKATLSTRTLAENPHCQNAISSHQSRSIAHIDMSEDDLRSWAAAAEALLPTLASVDQELSNSTLDDKVSGRRH